MIEIQTFEFNLTEGDEVHYEVALEPEENDDPRPDYMILIEDMEGHGEGLEAAIEGGESAAVSRVPQIRAFVGRTFHGSQSLMLRIRSGISRRVRVAIVRFRRVLRRGAGGLTCRACKMISKELVRLALAAIGVPVIDGIRVALDPAQSQALLEIANNIGLKSVADFLARADDWGLWSSIRGVLQALNFVFDMVDQLFEGICRELGFCP